MSDVHKPTKRGWGRPTIRTDGRPLTSAEKSARFRQKQKADMERIKREIAEMQSSSEPVKWW